MVSKLSRVDSNICWIFFDRRGAMECEADISDLEFSKEYVVVKFGFNTAGPVFIPRTSPLKFARR